MCVCVQHSKCDAEAPRENGRGHLRKNLQPEARYAMPSLPRSSQQQHVQASRAQLSSESQATSRWTIGQRISTRGRIAGADFSLRKFYMTSDCFSGRPVRTLMVSGRGNPDVIPLRNVVPVRILTQQRHVAMRPLATVNVVTLVEEIMLLINWCSAYSLSTMPFNRSFISGARFTDYLTTILRLSYDNSKVTVDLRQTSNLQNILRRTRGFSWVRVTCRIVRSSELVFVN